MARGQCCPLSLYPDGGASHSESLSSIVYVLGQTRPYMVDLQEDRSLVRNLLKLGIDVYLIDWGYPSR